MSFRSSIGFALLLYVVAGCASSPQSTTKPVIKDELVTTVEPHDCGCDVPEDSKTVTIKAVATGIDDTDPVEFFLIPNTSGKDYEALAICDIKPSELHKQLVAKGFVAGKPVNPQQRRFWPRGERVQMMFTWQQDGKEYCVRAEDLIIDVRTGKPLAQHGLVFTGSYILPKGDGRDRDLYAADVSDSKSIASNYNEPSTVFDLPRRAPQGEVYGFQKRNPAYPIAKGTPLTITIMKQASSSQRREMDLTLALKPGIGDAVDMTLADSNGKTIASGTGFPQILAEIDRLISDGVDPFLTPRVDPKLTIAQVRQAYGVLMALEETNGLRLDPPSESELFYEAFFPDEKWRDKEGRGLPAWEVTLEKDGGTTVGKLSPLNDADKVQEVTTIKSGDVLAKQLKDRSDRWTRVFFVFAPPTLTYGDLMSFVSPAMKTHSTVYVFLPRPASTMPSTHP